MWSKLDIRKLIDDTKSEYSKNRDKNLILRASILKGLYLALDGKKGVPLPNKYDNIVTYSKIVFKYKVKGMTDKSLDMLYNDLRKVGKVPEFYFSLCDNAIPKTNSDLAKIIASLITSDITEDLLINYSNLFTITYNIILEMER